MDSTIRLYSYWRSSASYRVRIALNLKQLKHEIVPVNLVKEGGEQHLAEFHQLNPQERVPVLIDGGRIVRQSLAIIEYLEEVYDGNHLLPGTARERARARGLAHLIATDISPMGNLSVLHYLEHEDGMPQIERERWVRTWIARGFAAFEEMLVDNPSTGEFCEGDLPSIADCCLVPQVYNAKRFELDLSPYPTLSRINDHCLSLPAFDLARPEKQLDAPKS
ncbi:MAG TPA: maleylacetoacetate isomerase [Patescibacteria group bacterium]|nr:maleylacetoacetate isomerase [Patescibacteria group bacterium]